MENVNGRACAIQPVSLGVGRLRKSGRTHKNAAPGSAAKPFQAAADVEIDAERPDIHRNRPDRLITVNDRDRAHFPGLLGDRRDVMTIGRFEQNVRDGDEGRPLVDRIDQALGVDVDAVVGRTRRQPRPRARGANRANRGSRESASRR